MTIKIRELHIRRSESFILTDDSTGESVLMVSVFQGIFMGHGNLDTSPEFKKFLNSIPQGDDLRLYGTDNHRTNPEWIRIIEQARRENKKLDSWIGRNYQEHVEAPEEPEFGEPVDFAIF